MREQVHRQRQAYAELDKIFTNEEQEEAEPKVRPTANDYKVGSSNTNFTKVFDDDDE